MVYTPWFIGPVVPLCGLPGELVHLCNGPRCVAVTRVYPLCPSKVFKFIYILARFKATGRQFSKNIVTQ